MKFKVGDKVRVRKDLKVGKAYYMENRNHFDRFTSHMARYAGQILEIERADSTYHAKENIWNWTDEMLSPVNDKKIVITSDGVETLARLYEGNKVIKTATAKCSPDDNFVFEEGARIALHRILGDYAGPIAENSPTTITDGIKRCIESTRKLADAVKAPTESDKKWRVVDRPVKVGDYIRLKHNDYSSVADVGDVLKVYSVGGILAQVLNKDITRPLKEKPDNFKWNYFFFEFEVVEPVEPEQQTEHKFKVGDRVRRTEESLPYWRKGDTGTIVGVDDSQVPYYIKKDRDGETAWSREDYLEKIEEPKYYNGKVVCISNENKPFAAVSGFTVGKVYTITDGIITNDTGWTNKIAGPLKTLEEVCACLGNKFIPFVE